MLLRLMGPVPRRVLCWFRILLHFLLGSGQTHLQGQAKPRSDVSPWQYLLSTLPNSSAGMGICMLCCLECRTVCMLVCNEATKPAINAYSLCLFHLHVLHIHNPTDHSTVCVLGRLAFLEHEKKVFTLLCQEPLYPRAAWGTCTYSSQSLEMA